MRTRTRLAVTTTLAASFVVAGAVPALAAKAARFAVVLDAPTVATAGQPVVATYLIRFVPNAARIEVQRLVTDSSAYSSDGSSWKTESTIRSARSGKGRIVLPAASVGAWPTRLAVTTSRGATLVRSATVTLDTYGTVSLAALCSGIGSVSSGNGSCSGNGSATMQIDGSIFTYVLADQGAQTAPAYDEVLQSPATSCRSITLDFAVDSEDGDSTPGESGSVSIVQSASPEVSASAPAEAGGRLTASLDGGPWDIDAQGSIGADGSNVTDLYIDGAANCYTTTGLK